jgi:hypothetical protein
VPSAPAVNGASLSLSMNGSESELLRQAVQLSLERYTGFFFFLNGCLRLRLNLRLRLRFG